MKTVSYGSLIKLQHVATSYRLHSHEIPYGTGSGQQSVTAFPQAGDANSLWLVKGPHGGQQPQMRSAVRCGDSIRLQHLATGKNLHSHEHRAPLNRDYEVSAYSDGGGDGVWTDGDTGDNWVLQCDVEGSPWDRSKKVYLRHVDTKAYLTSSGNLRYGGATAGQLQVSARSRRTSECYWKVNEGVFYSPTDVAKEN